jgi:hypothetical protein
MKERKYRALLVGLTEEECSVVAELFAPRLIASTTTSDTSSALSRLDQGLFHFVIFSLRLRDSRSDVTETGGLDFFDRARRLSRYSTYIMSVADPILVAIARVMSPRPFECLCMTAGSVDISSPIEDLVSRRSTTVRTWHGTEHNVDPLDFFGEEGVMDSTVHADSTCPGRLRLASGTWQGAIDPSTAAARIYLGAKVRVTGVLGDRVAVIPVADVDELVT